MKLYAIDIRSWTASFRYPNMLSGIQPTLEVPPVSTVLGLINAAAGQYIPHQQLTIGYYFEYGEKATDIETIYMIDSNNGAATNNAKSNIIKREFLSDNFLRIYVTDMAIAEYFAKPVYQLLLGRMNDLATADPVIRTLELEEIPKAEKLSGQLLPLRGNFIPGTVQALPKYFTDSIPRQNIGTEPYSIISHHKSIGANVKAYRDIVNNKAVDIYLHHLQLDQ
ncbi:CRISPR-associated protein, Cas5t family [Chitinophaga terrae (ex Kim and Jung 2007)]|uniref:CRISPR-associated protein, Cas5t family n=1 Tax=Chitinophaga terrae (ex Kim and Jung 2007) TaxID=408074 RepID=A0A1H4F037_9BACT|nr:type I-B CRISPR-associated protein Cas5b [Chitinophaga terrae (ex Kim and Jung 2007)]GEP90768.1 type I-B CRISPR-associated protein Cas5 [Chitinophaga terrae (ex Kim and Jung 2007)]SEA90551.1 CRISPR-associated protein, Cas5t family [Chitinophaga terrae (ex Kim and Jung 2007)]